MALGQMYGHRNGRTSTQLRQIQTSVKHHLGRARARTLGTVWREDSEVDDQRVRERVHQSGHAVVRRQEVARRTLVHDLAQHT